ncbi:hypothetical protein ABPG77_010293 [Micractinium sp. CCAP 211/92]
MQAQFGSTAVSDNPTGIYLDSAFGRVYVDCYNSQKVQVFSDSGTFLSTLANTGFTGNALVWAPTGVCGDPYGHVYVVDALRNDVQKFNADGTFGWKTSTSIGLYVPTACTYSSLSGSIWVTDTGNDRVVELSTANGAKLSTFSSIQLPTEIAAAPDGTLFVSSNSGFNMTQVTPTGEVLTQFGEFGTVPNQFRSLSGIAIQSVGGVPTTVYVSDENSDVIRPVTATAQPFSTTATLPAPASPSPAPFATSPPSSALPAPAQPSSTLPTSAPSHAAAPASAAAKP